MTFELSTFGDDAPSANAPILVLGELGVYSFASPRTYGGGHKVGLLVSLRHDGPVPNCDGAAIASAGHWSGPDGPGVTEGAFVNCGSSD